MLKKEKNFGSGGITGYGLRITYGLRVTDGQTDVEFEIVFQITDINSLDNGKSGIIGKLMKYFC